MWPFPGRQDVGIETEPFNQMHNLGISADKSSKLLMIFGIFSCVTRVIAGRLCECIGVSGATYLTQSDNGNNVTLDM